MVRIDDRLHPSLRRARPIAQRRIDALDRAARSHYGRVEVQEVHAKTALNDFSMGGRRAPDGAPVWSVNPYTGCAHACAYCYVPDTIKAERGRWGSYVIAKTNLPTLLMDELRRKPMGTTYLSTGTDPYQPAEAEHRITRRCLRQLARHDWPADVLTRSPLLLRDIDVFRRFSRFRVGLSVPSLDDAMRALIEPAAPPVDVRLAALAELAEQGFTVYANYSPAFPFTDGYTPRDLAATFADVGVQWVHISNWHRQRTVLPIMRARLQAAGRDDLLPMLQDGAQRRLHKAIRHAFAREGIPVETGFFNPPVDLSPAPTSERPFGLADEAAVGA